MNGNVHTRFDGIANIAVEHYKGIFQDPSTQNIREVLLTISTFNRLITDMPNETLLAPIQVDQGKTILPLI